ncbi:MAG: tetratricopeptide repeat protein, partial [Bacteroidota bacterium]
PDLWSFRSLYLDLTVETETLATETTGRSLDTNASPHLSSDQRAQNAAEIRRLEQKLRALTPEEVELRLAIYPELTELLRNNGTYDRAIIYLEEWLALVDGREQWEILLDLGDTYKSIGQLDKAEKTFAALKQAATSLESDDGDKWQGWASNRIGDLALTKGNILRARECFEQALTISKRLASAKPQSERLQRDLGVSNNKLGDLARAQGQLAEAQTRYEQALLISERLAGANPQSEELQRDLGISYEKLGDLAQAQGQLAEAQVRYESALSMSERLAAANPQSEQLQRDLVIAYIRLGDLAQAQGDLTSAGERYEQALAISERLASANPQSEELQRDLAVSYYKIGQHQLAQGKTAAAVPYFRKSLNITLQLLRKNLASVQLREDAVGDFAELASCYQTLQDTAALQALRQEKVDFYASLQAQAPGEAWIAEALAAARAEVAGTDG